MVSLKELNDLLSECATKLDHAASMVRDLRLEPSRIHMRSIGEALSHVFSIQRAIYDLDPCLMPEHLKHQSPHPDVNRQFGDIVTRAADLCDIGQFIDAIELYRTFMDTNPPANFVEMAQAQIKGVKQKHGV